MASQNKGRKAIELSDLPRLLKRLRGERGVSLRVLAHFAEVDVSVARRAELGRDARLSTWVSLFGALGYSLEVDYVEVREMFDVLDDERRERKDRQYGGLSTGKWRF